MVVMISLVSPYRSGRGNWRLATFLISFSLADKELRAGDFPSLILFSAVSQTDRSHLGSRRSNSVQLDLQPMSR